MKFIHTADWHLYANHKYSVGGSRLDRIKKNALLIINYAVKNNIKLIIISGDIYHTHNPDENIMKVFAEIIKSASNKGIHIRAITGNHDTNGKVTSLDSVSKITSGYDFLKVFTKGHRIETYGNDGRFIYVPYQENLIDVLRRVKGKRIDGINVLVTHGGINMAYVNPHKRIKSKLTVKHLSGWDYVAMGDYHFNQEVAKGIWYSGSIAKTAWNEKDEKKYFNVVELDGRQTAVHKVKLPDNNFIELIVNKDTLNEIKYGKNIKDSFIKLIVDNDCVGDLSMVKKILYNAGAIDITERITSSVLSNESADKGISMSLDIKQSCINFCKKYGMNNKKIIKYGIEKIEECHGA